METGYEHYIAVDWSRKNMAIARMTGKANTVKVIDVPSDVEELKLYLGACRSILRLQISLASSQLRQISQKTRQRSYSYASGFFAHLPR